jgi:UDP-N-acetylmuramate dehydrogenase
LEDQPISSEIDELARRLAGLRIGYAERVSLAPLTTFKIGGVARLLAKPVDTYETAEVVKAVKETNVNCIVLGAGSNLLIDDEGYPGLIVTTTAMNQIGFDERTVVCGSGVLLPELAEFVAERGISGMEEICDVPGTIGGGVYMNAGCSGVSLSDLIASVEWVTAKGEVAAKPRSNIKFGYRDSEFTKSDAIVTEITLRFTRSAAAETIRRRMAQVRAERAGKFPLHYPNCGSVFKRVDASCASEYIERDGTGAYSAGYYIERAGLKGARIGDAMVSEKHANFIVNLGEAKASDVRDLIELVKERVHEIFGVELEREVVYLGAKGRY